MACVKYALGLEGGTDFGNEGGGSHSAAGHGAGGVHRAVRDARAGVGPGPRVNHKGREREKEGKGEGERGERGIERERAWV